MTKAQAMQHGLRYAAGREDASGVKTVAPAGSQLGDGWHAFAVAYAQGWDDYNEGRRHMMPSARSAYGTWQASGGTTIFS